MTVLVEACVDSLRSAHQALAGGAGRLELCQNLIEGGSTPSLGLLAAVREQVALPLHVLIRPRAGDFLYDGDELAIMLRDISEARRAGVEGVLLGALSPDGQIDSELTRLLLDAADPLSVTFHRAFDLTRDPIEALDALLRLGVPRVLTSGQADSAEAGIAVIHELVSRSADRITVQAGGGIDEKNAARIVRETGVREIHLTGRHATSSTMGFRREGVALGKRYEPDEYRWAETSSERIRVVVNSVNSEQPFP